MLGVLPVRLVRQDLRLGTPVEAHRLGGGQWGGDLERQTTAITV